jgi:large subunit ribosomal protein L25
MERFIIEALPRKSGSKGSRNQMRAAGMVPAVVYGRGTEPLTISLDSRSLKKSLNTAAGSNVLLDLVIGGENGGTKETVMIKEVQRDPLQKDFILHADLIRISMTDKIEVQVPLNFTGEAAGVKEGGIFQVQKREIGIRCMPGDIPQVIDVPIEDLGIGDVLTVADLKLPQGIEILEDPVENLASILVPHEEMIPEEAEAEEEEAGAEKPAEEQQE